MKTRFERLKEMSIDDMANLLCKFTEAVLADADRYACDYCPASKYCSYGHIGYIDWLKENGFLNE